MMMSRATQEKGARNVNLKGDQHEISLYCCNNKKTLVEKIDLENILLTSHEI